jgi:hypothetical protein
MTLRSLRFVVVINLLCFSGCAAIVYKYYTLDQIPDGCYMGGKLLGKLGSGGWPDLSFSDCKPTVDNLAPCVVEFLTEHDKKETELLQCRQMLSDCQGGNPPSP